MASWQYQPDKLCPVLTPENPPPRRRVLASTQGFTLIELMAVVLVMAILVAIAMGVTGYVQKRIKITTARAELAAIEVALESYKTDWGYYPATGPKRISFNQVAEGSNNLILYRAIIGLPGRKRYITFPTDGIQSNMAISLLYPGAPGSLGLFDPWGKLWNYYNSPGTAYENVKTNAYAGYTHGGQVNARTYDLISYGPDGGTFIPGNPPYAFDFPWYGWYTASALWGTTNSMNDDIVNWK